MEFGEVGAAALGNRGTAEAAIVGFADGGVHAHFRRHAADEKRVDVAVLQDASSGVAKNAPCRLVDDDLA